jgi:4,5:9,10-diseco-3-hydroxy-5,9,17-trioxoandrosta-1(10),2-diene-4-oate hydrolase
MSATTPRNANGSLADATRVPAAEAAAYGPVGRSAWLDVDWREHQCWMTADGDVVNAIMLGEGPPLVFVHGLSGCWQNWLEQLPVLARTHRVVTLDLPGFGSSPMPHGEISISRYARVLDALLGQLGIDAAAVVGNSMGGFIGAELAISFPQRVERLVLISAAGLSTYQEPHTTRALPTLRRAEQALAATTAWMASRSDAVARRARLREATLALVVRHPSRLPAPLAAEQLRGAGKPGFLPALESIMTYDFRHRLPEIACPTLIVWGDGDRLITVRDADLFAELIGGSRRVIFEDTGHMAMLERPAAFNALLGDFLAE